MGRNCIVYGCSNTQKKGFSLFKFPTDTKLRRAWTLQVKRTRDKWDGPSKYSAICSQHFTEDCFEPISILSKKMGMKMKQMLKPGSIPTIIVRPAHVSGPKRLSTSRAYDKRERGRVSKHS